MNFKTDTYGQGSLAFLPIDIPPPSTSTSTLTQLFREFSCPCYTGYWDMLPIISRLDDGEWSNQTNILHNWKLRHLDLKSPNPSWFRDFDLRLPEIKKILKKLPFKQINTAYFLKQTKEVPPHVDLNHQIKESPRLNSNHLEPLLYKLLISDGNINSFYITPNKFSYLNHTLQNKIIKIFAKFPKKNCFFAISESLFYHGADYHDLENKFILSIFGILDHQKHIKLLRDSFNTYKSFSIRLEP